MMIIYYFATMYNSLQYKTKQFLFLLVKLAIIVGAFYFIYNKIVHNEQLKLDSFIKQLEVSIFNTNSTIFILIGFTFLNWFFEILKWQALVSSIKKISFFESLKQSLSSLTASLFTPNRIGEYGAKAIYYNKGQRRKIMLLNLLGNSAQMTTTVVFGIIGLIYFLTHFSVNIEIYRFRRAMYLLAFLIALVFFGKKFGYKKIRGFYIDKIISFIKKMPLSIHFKSGLYSALRYLIFSHQFYFLLKIFEVEIEYTTAMSLILSMYLIASLVPSLSFFDWLIKGTVAVWVFSFAHVNELIIVTITLLMWTLNFAIPAIFGSYYVINFNFSSVFEATNKERLE